MEGKFTVLENETDVLWIDKDTYTVARLKELVGDEIKKKFSANFTIAENNNTYNRNFRSYSNTIQINQLTLNTKSMTWNSDIIQQNNCQLLKVGSKGWQKGKLKIQSSFEYSSQTIETILEFCPDEPIETESPLDDIRKSMANSSSS